MAVYQKNLNYDNWYEKKFVSDRFSYHEKPDCHNTISFSTFACETIAFLKTTHRYLGFPSIRDKYGKKQNFLEYREFFKCQGILAI